MEKAKKCPECGRFYMGEGFSGVCTEYCFNTKTMTGRKLEKALKEIHGQEKKKIGAKKKEQTLNKSGYKMLAKLLRSDVKKNGFEKNTSF